MIELSEKLKRIPTILITKEEHINDWVEEAKALEQRIAELEAQTQWVSVDDRVPNKIARYVVYTNRGTLLMAWYIPETGWNADNQDVTHWIPLPPPPENE